MFYPNAISANGLVSNKDVSSTYNRRVVYLTVTATSDRTLHEAFFDPVALGAAVETDATNGYLQPAAFSLDGGTLTITSLKWESGTVTAELSPSVSLADYALILSM